MTRESNYGINRLGAALATLVSLITIVGVGYLVLIILGEILPKLALVYLGMMVAISIRTLLHKESYKESKETRPKSLNHLASEQLNSDAQKEFVLALAAISVTLLIGYYATSVAVVYYFSTEYSGIVAILGLILTVWFSFQTGYSSVKAYKIFQNKDFVLESKSRKWFRIIVASRKLRALLTLIFAIAVLAADMGLLPGV